MNPALDGPWSGTPALRLRRWYEASPEAIFRAFTDPALLRQWWGPRGFTIVELEFPAVEGGRYRVALRSPDGTRFCHEGTFLRVDPPAALVFTWKWVEGPLDQSETLVELAFAAERGGVVVDLHHSRFANQAECDKHVGWTHSFDRLETWLAGRQARQPQK